MARSHRRLFLTLLLGLGAAAPGIVRAEDQEQLPPYKMLRSLQFVQDAVVLGDHSGGEMQSFLLTALDERLRTAEKSVFDDSRNVDAALIYAMSGGNPTTLEFLMSRDTNGNFDNRVADVLRKYLNGKGLLVAKSLADTAMEYRDKKIGPYLSLVAGNVMGAKDPKSALKLYDWARLVAPGTIVEEAALRRSVALATQAGLTAQGLGYAQRYVRRFLHSPYAGQFADLFVTFVVERSKEMKAGDVTGILDFMDAPRQREVYLRIARRAAIEGRLELAELAASRAKAIPGDESEAFQSLAALYGGLAGIPTPGIDAARQNISTIPEGELNARDRALREAAQAVADAVLQPPDPDSLTQAISPNVTSEAKTEHSAAPANDLPGAPAAAAGDVQKEAAAPQAKSVAAARQDADASFDSFVTTSRSKLDALDGLLDQEGK